jgi:NitT/TauT family transport system permease protein
MKQVFKKNKSILISILSLLCVILLWEISLNIFDVSKAVLIKPSEIVKTSIANYDILLEEMLYTAQEIIPGWLIGNIFAFLLALFLYRRSNLAKPLVKASVLINSIPLIALTAIIGGIMGTNQDQKILLVSMITFFPTFIISLSELTSMDEGHMDLLLSYSAEENEVLRKVLLPKSIPSIFNSCKVTIVTAIFTAVTAEFFGGYGGIGLFILSKKGLCNLPLVWSGILYLAIFGTLFYGTFELIQRKLIKWQKS